MRYINKRGSLHVGRHVERGSALLATLYANRNSKDGGHKLHDFMPHEPEPVLTLEEAMKSWA